MELGLLAQLVERMIPNHKVSRSSRLRVTFFAHFVLFNLSRQSNPSRDVQLTVCVFGVSHHNGRATD
jgi:hypothetical protein